MSYPPHGPPPPYFYPPYPPPYPPANPHPQPHRQPHGYPPPPPPMHAYPIYMPGTFMVPVPIGPPPEPQASQPTYITNYIYHGNDNASSTPAITDQVSVVECSGDFDWIPTTSTSANQLTGKAVVGGHEGWDGSPLWVIRAWHQGELIPGKLSVRHCSASITHDGKEIGVQNIEVLCAKPENLRWVPATNGNVPPGAITAGRTVDGESLYVGRAKYQLSITPGKIQPSKNCCYISFAGTEVSHKMYDVLCRIS